jgi:Maltokinase N-terminal cap domain
MAVIHNTTMSPGKLDLLRGWLPAQPWYLTNGRGPELAKAGGFRLDDPAGEVGIEFMVVTDGSGPRAITYQVPLTYRAGALAGAEGGLIGTAEHGVLGWRWIYDGTCDPVLVAQLVALVHGTAEPQAQNASDTPDPTVIVRPAANGPVAVVTSVVAANGPVGTDLRIQTAGGDGMPNRLLIVRINRILRSGDGAGEAGQPCLSATWRLTDGTQVRGIFATARYLPEHAALRTNAVTLRPSRHGSGPGPPGWPAVPGQSVQPGHALRGTDTTTSAGQCPAASNARPQPPPGSPRGRSHPARPPSGWP